MDRIRIVRMAGAGVLAASLIAIAIALRGGSCEPDRADIHATSNPITQDRELARCQALGSGAATDPACREAWARNRERFFDVGHTRHDLNIDLFPSLSGGDRGHPPAETPAKPAAPAEVSGGWHR
ncbi:conjugative transfer region protein TrbK [Rhizobiales bacterium GAS113]|nr:conjugative transfer region protein TrbK [Rhizobiales bacterium GAS113]